MAQRHRLEATSRTRRARSVRTSGAIPAVMYGHGLSTHVLQVNTKQFQHIWQLVGLTSVVDLAFENKIYPVLIRDVQLHPVTGDILHTDFYQVRMDEVIRASVPVTFVGEANAVKELGGVLVKNRDELELEALPGDLPHQIQVDISGLATFDDVIRMTDIKVPPGVKVLHEADEVVALVQPPRSDKELEQLSEEVKEDVEAVEGVKKEEPKPEGEAATTDEKTPDQPAQKKE